MILNRRFLEQLIDAWIFTDETGLVLAKNGAADSLLRGAGMGVPRSITEIDPLFRSDPLRFLQCPRRVRMGKRSRQIRIFPAGLKNHQNGFLYLFETAPVLKIMDFEAFLDCLDTGVAVAGQDGTLEHLNQSLSGSIGVDVKEWIGRRLQDLVAERTLTQSASLRALKAKKPVCSNVTYGAGTTLAWQSVPVQDGRGAVRKIVSTGRDVTRIIKLEQDLTSSETLKERYQKQLNTLEVLLGKDRIVYSSEAMKRVAQVASKASKFDSPVLLWGESGVGKEMIARMIHQGGNRSKGPFVSVNCSAVPAELLESEFFGYEEGAFTGARKGGRKGLFEEAEKGTLFLDEISELPLGVQSKLLRVIQEHEFMRVGSSKTTPTDVRIIAATNLSREQLMEGLGFRRDLFYRLSVIPIYIPPLRERREDILPLIRYFLKTLNIKYGTEVRIAHALIPRLYHYDWPGNIRELKNVIERLLVVANSNEVGDEEYELLNQLEIKNAPKEEEEIAIARLMPLRQAMEKVEQILFGWAYRESGSIERAARVLEVDPSTIHRKIKKGQLKVKP